MTLNIPTIDSQFVCIVDYEKPEFAAVISSYLFKENHYLPLFQFFSATYEKCEPNDDVVDESTISRIHASQFARFCNNIVARFPKCEYLILAGLSKSQKSYLEFMRYFNVIEIDSLNEIDFYLSPFISENRKVLRCKRVDLLIGLFTAQKNNQIIQIDEYADELVVEAEQHNGIVIIENENYIGPVIAVNYASSIKANIYIVHSLEEDEELIIQNDIEQWRKGNQASYQQIEEMVKTRLKDLVIKDFAFATFFTGGLPYSLILKNCIPCSYVHISFRPDFFIINNLLFEGKNKFGGGIVFSPQFFEDEETKTVSSILKTKNYFIKDLIAENATVANLSMNLQEFPYDIFHICSHGGEIHGYEIKEKFVDRYGNQHTIECDHVFSFSPSSKAGFVTVQHKVFPKKINGFIWKSLELKKQNYHKHVFVDMLNATITRNKNDKWDLSCKKVISNSCHIQCSDSSYQGMVQEVAMHSSPIIFNNTCWSWYQIAEHFLLSGVRGYIGTIWDVDSNAAVDFSKEFYQKLFSDTILNSFYSSLRSLTNSKSENIYVFWGLHFSTISPPDSKSVSRANVYKQLYISSLRWKKKLDVTKVTTTKNVILDKINWIKREVKTTFDKNDLQKLMQDVIKNRMNSNEQR